MYMFITKCLPADIAFFKISMYDITSPRKQRYVKYWLLGIVKVLTKLFSNNMNCLDCLEYSSYESHIIW